MNFAQILLTSEIKERICSNLNFLDARNFRDAFNLSSLKSPISIDDTDQQILLLKGVNALTIEAYSLIQNFGSRKACIIAAQTGQIKLIQLLIESTFNPQFINEPDLNGDYPLICASFRGYFEIVHFLLICGANPNLLNLQNESALFCSARNGFLSIVQLLINFQADLTLRNSKGETPLIVASGNGHFQVVNFLIREGSSIEESDQIGNTPLIWAVRNNHQNVVQLLISKGARINRINNIGITALMVAARNGYFEMVQFLLKSGADKTIVNRVGKTAWNLARENGHSQVANLFEEENLTEIADLLKASQKSNRS